jgi:hypothetical protein
MNNLSLVYLELDRHAEAASLLEQVVEARRTTLGTGHPQTLGSLYNLACVQALLGDLTAAKASLRAAVDAGFAEVDLLEQDPDLASLRGDPEAADLIAAARANRDRLSSSLSPPASPTPSPPAAARP